MGSHDPRVSAEQYEINTRTILRAAHVIRWNIIKTSHHQSVAEHSFNVYWIAREITDVLNGYIGNSQNALPLRWTIISDWAMSHDIGEVLHGDIPSPTKIRLGASIAAVEITDLDRFPNGTRAYEAIRGMAEEHVVKIADMIDALQFLYNNCNSDQATRIAENIDVYITNAIKAAIDKWPRYGWEHIHDLKDSILWGPEAYYV